MNFSKLLRRKATTLPNINESLQLLSKRAERLGLSEQAETLSPSVASSTVYGTQIIESFSAAEAPAKRMSCPMQLIKLASKDDIAILLDLRTIGSNSYIYTDETMSVADRATHLLRDFLAALHNAFLDLATEPRSTLNLSRLGTLVDQLGASIREIVVLDTVRSLEREANNLESGARAEARAKLAVVPSLDAHVRAELRQSEGTVSEVSTLGHPRLSVNIGRAHKALADLADRTEKRIWVLIDEWSTLPEVLQPYLADFIKRTLFPIRNYSVYIAAVEQRTTFRADEAANRLGIELGADAFADINLDDYLVFDNHEARSLEFFKQMLFRHLKSVDARQTLPLRDADDFIKSTFSQEPAFRELVRACEGVPRDAINILQMAARRAGEQKISIPHIREAARDWFQTDKASYLSSNREAESLLDWIVQRVIGERKAKAFLVKADVRDAILERLFDERVLHVARKSYSTHQEPGVRYKVWKLDYGCYVHWINTSKEPSGYLFEGLDIEQNGTIPVPEDDFRAIRRAILDISEFRTHRTEDSSSLSR